MAVEKDDYAGLVAAIRTRWELNQRLAPVTNPAAIQAILDKMMDYLDAAKLLGAGGGGYLFMLAKDLGAAKKLRQILAE